MIEREGERGRVPPRDQADDQDPAEVLEVLDQGLLGTIGLGGAGPMRENAPGVPQP
ncbi:MAG TPA: hypothetical protein VMW47_13330 [Verrucomicrobiae bacterium]|nr:hypothetical protein [Verrucomicrobiae bacterium]